MRFCFGFFFFLLHTFFVFKNQQKFSFKNQFIFNLLSFCSFVLLFSSVVSNSDDLIDYVVFLHLNIYVKYIFVCQYVSILFINKIGICSIVNLLGKFYLDVAGSCFCVCVCVLCEINIIKLNSIRWNSICESIRGGGGCNLFDRMIFCVIVICMCWSFSK